MAGLWDFINTGQRIDLIRPTGSALVRDNAEPVGAPSSAFTRFTAAETSLADPPTIPGAGPVRATETVSGRPTDSPGPLPGPSVLPRNLAPGARPAPPELHDHADDRDEHDEPDNDRDPDAPEE